MNWPSSIRRRISRSQAITAVLFSFLAVGSTDVLKAVTESAEYKPEGDMYIMEAHFHWCGEAKTPAERLKRYQKFWEMQHPETEDGYDDGRHVRMVRHCAYRLAQLYAELGKTKDCVGMLKWLEKEDDGFEVERG
jgi:hypothetical protein